MRYFAIISYNGANYCGWQIQQNSRTIEQMVEYALSTILGEKIDVVGAGRTDSGVNAIEYIAHFDASDDTKLLHEPGKVLYKTNAILPGDITISAIYPVHSDAHARFDAIQRRYYYYVHTVHDPFAEKFSYYCKFPLNMDKMNIAAQYMVGKRDFSCFEKLHGSQNGSVCELTHAIWENYAPELSVGERSQYLRFTVSANRFLRNMVRAMVGSLLEVGRGKREPEWIKELLEKGTRSDAGQSVPGNPLFLRGIEYPYDYRNDNIIK